MNINLAVLILAPSVKNQLRLRGDGSDTNTGSFPTASYALMSLDLPADPISSVSTLRTGIVQRYVATLERGNGKSTDRKVCLPFNRGNKTQQ